MTLFPERREKGRTRDLRTAKREGNTTKGLKKSGVAGKKDRGKALSEGEAGGIPSHTTRGKGKNA